MRKILLSLTTVASLAAAASGAYAAPLAMAGITPLPASIGTPAVETVQYYRPGYSPGYGYNRQYSAYDHHDGYGRWRRHEERRRWHYRHEW